LCVVGALLDVLAKRRNSVSSSSLIAAFSSSASSVLAVVYVNWSRSRVRRSSSSSGSGVERAEDAGECRSARRTLRHRQHKHCLKLYRRYTSAHSSSRTRARVFHATSKLKVLSGKSAVTPGDRHLLSTTARAAHRCHSIARSVATSRRRVDRPFTMHPRCRGGRRVIGVVRIISPSVCLSRLHASNRGPACKATQKSMPGPLRLQDSLAALPVVRTLSAARTESSFCKPGLRYC
jgi:hypothetical protein